jgi:hypothetical protein
MSMRVAESPAIIIPPHPLQTAQYQTILLAINGNCFYIISVNLCLFVVKDKTILWGLIPQNSRR